MKYALIENDHVVNVIWLNPANEKDFVNAVPVEGLPVQAGDAYVDGEFYRDGEKVLSPSHTARAEQDELKEALSILGVNVNE